MPASDSAILYTCAVAFFVVALWTLAQLGTDCGRKPGPDRDVRRLFLALLFTGMSMRVGALIAEAQLKEPLWGHDAWVSYLVNTLPDLVFLSLYSLLLFYWARMRNLFSSNPWSYLWLPFVALNVFAYTGYACVAMHTHHTKRYKSFRVTVEYAQGVLYLVGLVAVAYLGSRVVQGLRPPRSSASSPLVGVKELPSTHTSYGTLSVEPDSSLSSPAALQAAADLSAVRCRVTLLCVLCVAVFLVKGVLALLIATDAWHNSAAGYPLSPESAGRLINRYIYDATSRVITELLPSLAILLVIRRRNKVARHQVMSTSSMQSDGDIAFVTGPLSDDDDFVHTVIGPGEVTSTVLAPNGAQYRPLGASASPRWSFPASYTPTESPALHPGNMSAMFASPNMTAEEAHGGGMPPLALSSAWTPGAPAPAVVAGAPPRPPQLPLVTPPRGGTAAAEITTPTRIDSSHWH